MKELRALHAGYDGRGVGDDQSGYVKGQLGSSSLTVRWLNWQYPTKVFGPIDLSIPKLSVSPMRYYAYGIVSVESVAPLKVDREKILLPNRGVALCA